MTSLYHFSLYKKIVCFIKQVRLLAIISNFFWGGGLTVAFYGWALLNNKATYVDRWTDRPCHPPTSPLYKLATIYVPYFSTFNSLYFIDRMITKKLDYFDNVVPDSHSMIPPRRLHPGIEPSTSSRDNDLQFWLRIVYFEALSNRRLYWTERAHNVLLKIGSASLARVVRAQPIRTRV
jgi:hypothetical protein